MITLTAKRIRAQVDCGSYENFKDATTASTLKLWKGNALRMEVGLFFGLANATPVDAQLVDLTASAIESITVEVKESAASLTNLMSKTTSTLNTSLTAAQWLALTHQHAVLEFTAAETNIAAGTHHLVISGLTVGGSPITFGVSKIEIKEDGAGLEAGDPEENPGAGLSLDTADARYVRRVTAPASTDDDSMFTGGVFPASGIYEAFSASPPRHWIYVGGQAQWFYTDLSGS